jgi:hypothetical protein
VWGNHVRSRRGFPSPCGRALRVHRTSASTPGQTRRHASRGWHKSGARLAIARNARRRAELGPGPSSRKTPPTPTARWLWITPLTLRCGNSVRTRQSCARPVRDLCPLARTSCQVHSEDRPRTARSGFAVLPSKEKKKTRGVGAVGNRVSSCRGFPSPCGRVLFASTGRQRPHQRGLHWHKRCARTTARSRTEFECIQMQSVC